MVGEGAATCLTPSAYGPVKLFQGNYYFGSSPGNCQMRIQHPVKYLRSSVLRKYLTDESRYLFSQNSPSYIFDKILNTPLTVSKFRFVKYHGLRFYSIRLSAHLWEIRRERKLILRMP